jgi:hypothetical protein
MTVLLNAPTALSLLTERDGVFAPTPVATRFLTAGSKDDARDALRHNLSLCSAGRRSPLRHAHAAPVRGERRGLVALNSLTP